MPAHMNTYCKSNHTQYNTAQYCTLSSVNHNGRGELATKSTVNTTSRLTIYLVVSVAVVSLSSLFGPTLYLINHQTSTQDLRLHIPKRPHRNIIEVDDLDHEERFTETLKSCLPRDNPKKCGKFVAEPQPPRRRKVQRVAVLAPPGDMSLSLLNRIEAIANYHNQRSTKHKKNTTHTRDLDIEVILTSHVPPYGYGKTHGLTKIVRFIPEPLILQVTDSLTALLQPGETHETIDLFDLKASLRMILRFHCRISHVAAHTATESVTFVDLLGNPTETNNALTTYLESNDQNGSILARGGNEEWNDDLKEAPDDDPAGLMDAGIAYGAQILTHVQSSMSSQQITGHLLEILDNVLLDELRLTNNMKKWPCQSFWAAADPDKTLSNITKQLARALSPNCDDPYAKCFVERDKCEYREDAKCRKKKSRR